MQIPLQISVRGIDHSPALEAHIRDRTQRLERFHERITRCQVVVEARSRHRVQGNAFDVRVEVHVPGRAAIVASHKHDQDVYVALREAFDAVVRQLDDEARERRGDVTTP